MKAELVILLLFLVFSFHKGLYSDSLKDKETVISYGRLIDLSVSDYSLKSLKLSSCTRDCLYSGNLTCNAGWAVTENGSFSIKNSASMLRGAKVHASNDLCLHYS